MKKLKKFFLILKITLFMALLSGCAITISPPIQHYYVPLYPDTSYVMSAGVEIYNWPVTLGEVRPHSDTALLFFDTHSSGIVLNDYLPLFSDGTFTIGFNPFLKAGIWRIGAYQPDVGMIHSFSAFIGMGVRVLPHLSTRHALIGMSLVPAAGGLFAFIVENDTFLKNIKVNFGPLPEMLNMAGIYAYYITSNDHVSFYTGPFFQLYLPTLSGGMNTGIVLKKMQKEDMRLSFSIGYYSDAIYKDYKLFPFAFMLSIWKTFY